MGSTLLTIVTLIGCFIVGFMLGTDYGVYKSIQAYKGAVRRAYKAGSDDTLAVILKQMTSKPSKDTPDEKT